MPVAFAGCGSFASPYALSLGGRPFAVLPEDCGEETAAAALLLDLTAAVKGTGAVESVCPRVQNGVPNGFLF